jgi:hypothetical protein
MSATASDRNTLKRMGHQFNFPVAANTKIYVGTLVCINASGYATKGATATTLKCAGVATEQVDNTNGNDGDKSIATERGTFQFANSASADAITLADINASCYIVDDSTVAKTSGTNTRSLAGIIVDVDSNGVWVKI